MTVTAARQQAGISGENIVPSAYSGGEDNNYIREE